MRDQSNHADLAGALERLCVSGEHARVKDDGELLVVIAAAGRLLQSHPGALELVDSLEWHRLRARLRDITRHAPGPLTSDLRELVPRALRLAMRGKNFDFVALLDDDLRPPPPVNHAAITRQFAFHSIAGGLK